MVAEKKKRGRGNPTPPFIGPKHDKRRDLPDASKPKCNASYRDGRGIERRCGKRGYHWKHGPGNG